MSSKAIYDIGVTGIGIMISETAKEMKKAIGLGVCQREQITCIQQEASLGLSNTIKISQDLLADAWFVMLPDDDVLRGSISSPILSQKQEQPDRADTGGSSGVVRCD